MIYKNTMLKTLYEYYLKNGQPMPSVAQRAAQASAAGINNYVGSAEQNNKLLAYLQTLPAPVPVVQTPANNTGTPPQPAPILTPQLSSASTAQSSIFASTAQGGQATNADFDNLVNYHMEEQQPYYNDLSNYDNSMSNSYLSTAMRNYQNSVGQSNEQARIDLADLDDEEGRKGTWASSGRQERRKNLQNKYNFNNENIFNSTQDNLYQNRLKQAYQYGDSAVTNNSPIYKNNVNMTDTGATFNNVESGAQFNPFKFYGRVNVDKKQSADIAARNTFNTNNYNSIYK